MKKSFLSPSDGRKSFYGKAVILEDEAGTKYLKSYETIVCKCTAAGVFSRLWDDWSATTARHVNAFRDHCGLAGLNKREWEQLKVEG